MGKIVKYNQSCNSCGSSDARQIYEDGNSFCFSCNKFFPKKTIGSITLAPKRNYKIEKMSLLEIDALKSARFADRGISAEVNKFFDVKATFNEKGEIEAHYYPYRLGCKIRELPKNFYWIGTSGGLFGQDKFNGTNQRLVICEGEIDALSIAEAQWQKYKRIYPVVALSSSTATKDILANRDWIRNYNEVVLCFDQDQAGEKATTEAARIIGFDKTYVAQLPENDVNDVLLKRDGNTVINCVLSARKYTPSGIINKDEIWDALVKYNSLESIPYPRCLGGLNEKLKGMRFGEIALFVSGTGSGKSSMIREIIYHLLLTTTDKIGIVALEEAPAETARKLSSLVLNKNSAKEEIPLEELKRGFDKIFGDDRIVLLDHQGAVADISIVDQLEYMALVDCKYLFIDHITILVSEGVEGLTGNESQDKMMNDLLRLVKKHNIYIGLISHLRKTPNQGKSFEEGKLPTLDDIRGCLAYDTEVLLNSGHATKVQDIVVGDKLMGDDGTPREVLCLKRGIQQMYKVTMKTSNDSFVCNSDHVLTLSHNDRMFDMPLKSFLMQSESFKTRCKLHYSEGYDLVDTDLLIPPYSLGAWLGDGSAAAFRIMDASGLNIAERVAKELNAIVQFPSNINREYCNFITPTKGEMLNKLKSLNLYKNKHIPDCYRYSSKTSRLELLAGLLDTDGTFSKEDHIFYFYQKDEKLANDVKDIARSVGLYSTVRPRIINGHYSSSNGTIIYAVTISGEIGKIPAQKLGEINRKLNALKRGVLIEKLDIQEYYGFQLDGNGRFVLGNHIITHNSGSVKQISMDVIGFARDMTAPDMRVRNAIKMSVLKSRHTGLTGPVDGAYYNYDTGRLLRVDVSSFDIIE